MVWAGPLLPGGTLFSGAIPNLLLIHTWFPNPYIFISMNGVNWSLSCELFFYLMFPIWLILIKKIPADHLWYGVFTLWALVISVPLVSHFLPQQPLLPWRPTPLYEYWFVYLFPPVRMLEFLIGIFMARIVQENRWIYLRLSVAACFFIIGYAIALYVPYQFSWIAATIIPLALFIPAAAIADIRGFTSPLRSPLMIKLGNISFAFYLVHRLILMYGHRWLGMHSQWSSVYALAFIVGAGSLAIMLAALLYTWVEQPVMVKFARRGRQITATDVSNFQKGAQVL
jgi:peptidoglycan/LPS O-acetylase OafA/YrhL